MKLPTTASGFFRAIERDLGNWNMEIKGGSPFFWRALDVDKEATVSFEHGALWVNLAPYNYYFEFSRLHEDIPQWSWRQHLGEKSWCRIAHLELLYQLEKLFPFMNGCKAKQKHVGNVI